MSTPNYLRLSYDQQALLEYIKDAPLSLLNIPVRVDLESEIDEEKAVEAMKIAVMRLPYCTLRLHKQDDGELVQYMSDEEPTGFEIVDFSDKTDEDVEEYIFELASTPFPNECMDVQLYDFKLIRTPNGKHSIYFNGFHELMDSVGMIYTIVYFDKCYNALVNGTELPPEGVGPEKAIEDSWKYKESPKHDADIEWWKNYYTPEPCFASMNPKPSPEYIEGKRYGKAQDYSQYAGESMPIRIPAETVKAIDDAAKANNLSAQVYYALAFRTYLAHNSGCDDVCFDTTGARRATLYQKNCGMTVAHQITWRTIIPGTATFKEGLLEMTRTQREMYRHIGVMKDRYTEWMSEAYHVPADCTYISCVLTYQPYFNSDDVKLNFSANHVNTGLAWPSLYLNLMPHDNTGDLWADYMFAYTYLKKENLLKFHDFMLKFIFAGIAAPEKTIDELVAETL